MTADFDKGGNNAVFQGGYPLKSFIVNQDREQSKKLLFRPVFLSPVVFDWKQVVWKNSSTLS